MIYAEHAVSKLFELLDTVSRMPQVPDVHESAQSNAAFKEWQKQFHKFNDLEHEAEIIALCTIPTEVQEMLSQVRAKVRERQRISPL